MPRRSGRAIAGEDERAKRLPAPHEPDRPRRTARWAAADPAGDARPPGRSSRRARSGAAARPRAESSHPEPEPAAPVEPPLVGHGVGETPVAVVAASRLKPSASSSLDAEPAVGVRRPEERARVLRLVPSVDRDGVVGRGAPEVAPPRARRCGRRRCPSRRGPSRRPTRRSTESWSQWAWAAIDGYPKGPARKSERRPASVAAHEVAAARGRRQPALSRRPRARARRRLPCQ